MGKNLPFKDTLVRKSKSVSELIDELGYAGFDNIGQRKIEDRYIIIAQRGKADFIWTVQTKPVYQALYDDLGPSTKKSLSRSDSAGKIKKEKLERQAERVAFRILADKIRADCIAVRYGAQSYNEVFAGNLLIKDGKNTISVGQFIDKMGNENRLNLGTLMNNLALPAPKGK